MRIALMIVAFALTACGQRDNTYPADVSFNFMRACESQGPAPGVCACTWDKIEAGVSPSDFAALERLPGPQREEHPLTAQINGYAMSCAQPPAPATPATEPSATP